MFGLGIQEILILLCCGGLPVGVIIILLINRQTRKREPENDLDDETF